MFVRFSGCNLWSGREEDRAESRCNFCDTDINGMNGSLGGSYSAEALMKTITTFWNKSFKAIPYVVFTGGEPSLQLDDELLDHCKAMKWETGIETNGSRALPTGIDWVCVSPKSNVSLMVTNGDELKLVYPQAQAKPQDFENLNFKYFYLQPLWDRDQKYWKDAAQYCLQNPQWRLSLQTHKILGMP